MADHNPGQDSLTAVQFDELLRRLDGRVERAGEKYETIRWKLVKFFQWSSCVAAEDLADVTLNRVARKLTSEGDTIQNIESFAWGVAKKIRHEARKKDVKTIYLPDLTDQNTMSDAGATTAALHKKIQTQQQLRHLHHCLQRLPAEDRTLFVAYRLDKGHYKENRNNLAKRFGLTAGALRVRIIRVREKLEACMARCLGTK